MIAAAQVSGGCIALGVVAVPVMFFLLMVGLDVWRHRRHDREMKEEWRRLQARGLTSKRLDELIEEQPPD